MKKNKKKPFNRNDTLYGELAYDEIIDKSISYTEEYLQQLKEDIGMWEDIIADDIERNEVELLKMDRARLNETKVIYRQVKMMMQKPNRLETAIA